MKAGRLYKVVDMLHASTKKKEKSKAKKHRTKRT
jgi:hypothetical protein